MSTTVTTPMFRASYCSLTKPRLNELNGQTEYSVVALFPKDADISMLRKAAQAAIVKKWGPDPKKHPKGLKMPFRDQGERAKEDETTGVETLPDGYEKGAIFMNLKSKDKPGIVDGNRQPVIEDSEVYSGRWMRASINFFAYDQKGNKGVSAGLNHIQVGKNDKPLGGGRSRATDAFTNLTEEESAESAADYFNT